MFFMGKSTLHGNFQVRTSCKRSAEGIHSPSPTPNMDSYDKMLSPTMDHSKPSFLIISCRYPKKNIKLILTFVRWYSKLILSLKLDPISQPFRKAGRIQGIQGIRVAHRPTWCPSTPRCRPLREGPGTSGEIRGDPGLVVGMTLSGWGRGKSTGKPWFLTTRSGGFLRKLDLPNRNGGFLCKCVP